MNKTASCLGLAIVILVTAVAAIVAISLAGTQDARMAICTRACSGVPGTAPALECIEECMGR